MSTPCSTQHTKINDRMTMVVDDDHLNLRDAVYTIHYRHELPTAPAN